MWEQEIDTNQVVEIRTKTTAYLGVGAIHKMNDIAAALTARGIRKVVVVSGKGSHIKSGAWDAVKNALAEKGIAHVLYNKITPNPTVDHVDEAAKLARDFGAAAVIAIGGGSPIDAGKGVAVMLAYPERTARELCEFKFAVEKAAPIIAINLTHGTGTEVDRFAVITIPEKEFKPALAFDCLYPLYSIDDPNLMTLLPPDQTSFVSVDAVNHVIEAATTSLGNPLAITLAKETISLVARYLPLARKEPFNLKARYHLLYASLIGGVAFDNGLLHLTHALEHPLSGLKPELAHGLGLGILLPSVVKHIYPTKGKILAEILAPLVSGLKGTGGEADHAAAGLKIWLKGVGIGEHLTEEGFSAQDLDRLVELAFSTPSLESLLGLSPIKATREVVRAIYQDSL